MPRKRLRMFVPFILLISALVLGVGALSACGAADPPGPTPPPYPLLTKSAAVAALPLDATGVYTQGNHSYIPINIAGKVNDRIYEILYRLDKFEKDHPEFEVLPGWKIEAREEALTERAFIYGIWVDHKPKSR